MNITCLKPASSQPQLLLSQIALGDIAGQCQPGESESGVTLDGHENIMSLRRFFSLKGLSPVTLPAICVGLPCVINNAEQIAIMVEQAPELIGLPHSSKFERAMCLGHCYAAPVIQAANETFYRVSAG